MTSKRELKKDINYLSYEFIADCYLYIHTNPENEEVINEIIDKVIDARNSLIHLLHHPEDKHKRFINKDKVANKKRKIEHSKKVNESFASLVKMLDESYDELNKISKLKS